MRPLFRAVLSGALLALPATVLAQQAIRAGSRTRGALAAGDAQLGGGEFMDVYTVVGQAGQRLVIRMMSTAFDPYLLMRGPSDFSQDNDDEASGSTAARLEVRLPADGQYRIIATSYRPGEQGEYELDVQDASSGVVAAPPAGTIAAPGGGTLAPGQTARGSLASGDETLSSGELADTWRVQGRAGQQLTIRLSSSDFDPYLLVRGPGTYTQDNDDDATERGSRNSRLDLTLPADGEYRVIATSYRSGESGAYTISLQGSGAAAPAAPVAAAPQTSGRLQIGRLMPGRLENGDGQLRSGEFVDAYSFQGARGQRLELRLNSTEFDPYVQINGPGNFSQYNDDDVDGGTSNAHLIVTLPADGVYQVMATSYRPGETGAYQLTATATMAVAAGAGVAAAAARLTLDRPVMGSLQTSDDSLPTGEFVDRFRFEAQAGQRIALDMTSTELDSYVLLVSPSGRQEENDDAREGVNDARLETVLTETGTYAVMATSYQRGMTGTYRLSLSPLDGTRTPTTTAVSGPAPAGTALRVGAAQNGRLETGDGTLSSGEFVDRYTFQGRRGQVVTVDMTSSDLDPYLLLTAPGGAQQENDDVSASDRNARVTWVLPATGTYAILATTYRPAETGSYSLRLATGAAGAARPGPVAAAGTAPRQRVFAVLVGITDYAGSASNLPYTAEDAQKLAQTLTRAGVLAEGSAILTDADATYDRVRTAFQQVAQRAGPDDLFLFFYSGHGTQVDGTTSASEPDGRNEAIVLRDRLVRDDEMGQWFQQVHARMSLIALDACFSGGFARNVVNQPGVMGLFSSEEDLTSAVAGKFQAGGYLSHFLRTALAGEADSDRNSQITAGELSAYLRRQFSTQAADVEAVTSERQRNYQYLVVERGGVKIDDLVLALAAR